jgi:hypothetical protein
MKIVFDLIKIAPQYVSNPTAHRPSSRSTLIDDDPLAALPAALLVKEEVKKQLKV